MATRQSTPKLKTPLTHSVNNTVASSIETHALATPITNQETNNFREEITTELITPIIEQETSTLRQALVSSSLATPMLLPSVNGTYTDPYDSNSIRFINNKCVYTCTGLCCAFDNALAPYQTQMLLSPVNINGTLATTVEQALHMINTARTQVNVDWDASSGVSAICNKPILASVATLGTYSSLTDKPDFARVACSGCYCDLCGVPAIPAAQVNSDWLATEGVALICNKPELSCVACSGDYNDLCNKPDLCQVQQQSDWNQADSNCPTYIKNKPELARVATSGLYADLLGAPVIPEQVNSDWLALSGPAYICNKPSLSEVALSGDYNDLRNIPPDTSKTYTFSFDESTHKLAVTEHGLFGDTVIFNDTIDTAYSFEYEDNTLTITDNRNNTYTVNIGTDFYTKCEINDLISAITDLIPEQASSTNQLADKNFVNSSIATNTANFCGTFNNLACLCAIVATPNDYAFYAHCDTCGNCVYDRYKYNASCVWVCEYTLNNSSFTAAQWAAINSGITDIAVAKITDVYNCTIKLCNADGTALLGSFTLNQNQNTCICLNVGGGTVTGINVYCGSSCVCTIDDNTALCLSSNAFNAYAQINTTTYPGACCTGTLVASDLNGYATCSWVTGKGYATCSWVTGKGYTTCTGTVTSVNACLNGTNATAITSSGTLALNMTPSICRTGYKVCVCLGNKCSEEMTLPNQVYTKRYTTSGHNKYLLLGKLAVSSGSVSSLSLLLTTFGNNDCFNLHNTLIEVTSGSSANALCVKGWTDVPLTCDGTNCLSIVVTKDTTAGCWNIYACSTYQYQDYSLRVLKSFGSQSIDMDTDAASVTGTVCFNSTADADKYKISYIKDSNIFCASRICRNAVSTGTFPVLLTGGTTSLGCACVNVSSACQLTFNAATGVLSAASFSGEVSGHSCIYRCQATSGTCYLTMTGGTSAGDITGIWVPKTCYATFQPANGLLYTPGLCSGYACTTPLCTAFSMTCANIYYIKIGSICACDGRCGMNDLLITARGTNVVDKVRVQWGSSASNNAINQDIISIDKNSYSSCNKYGIVGFGWVSEGNNWNCKNWLYLAVRGGGSSAANICIGLERVHLNGWATVSVTENETTHWFQCTTTEPSWTCFVCLKRASGSAYGSLNYHWDNMINDHYCSAKGTGWALCDNNFGNVTTISAYKNDNSGYKTVTLMYDITSWYNGSTGVSGVGFVGSLYATRISGYTTSFMTNIAMMASYGRNGAALANGGTLQLYYQRTSGNTILHLPVIIKDSRCSTNVKYWLAMLNSGSGHDFVMIGQSWGTRYREEILYSVGTDSALPTGVEILMEAEPYSAYVGNRVSCTDCVTGKSGIEMRPSGGIFMNGTAPELTFYHNNSCTWSSSVYQNTAGELRLAVRNATGCTASTEAYCFCFCYDGYMYGNVCGNLCGDAATFGGCTYAQAKADIRDGLCSHDCLVKYTAVSTSSDRNVLMMGGGFVDGCICPVYFNNVSGKKFTYNACCGQLKIGPIVACTSSTTGSSGVMLGLGYMELSACTPYIDFHRAHACQDYSSRIIDGINGGLCVIVNNATGCTASTTSCTFCFLPTGVFKSPYDICSPYIRASTAIEALNFYNMTQAHGTQPASAACCPNITFTLRCRYNSGTSASPTWSISEKCVIMCGADGGLYADHRGCTHLNWHGIVTCQCNYSLTANTIYYIKVGRLLDGFMTGTTELDIMASGSSLVDKVNIKWLGGCANDAANVNGIEINATNFASLKGLLGIGWVRTGTNWNCANDIYIKVCAPATATYCFGLNRTLLGCAGNAWTTGFSCTTTAPSFTCFICTKPNEAKAFHWTSGTLYADTICSCDGILTTCTGTVTGITLGSSACTPDTNGNITLPAYPPDLSSCAGLTCTGTVTILNDNATECPIALCTGTNSVGRSTGCPITFNPATGLIKSCCICADAFNLIGCAYALACDVPSQWHSINMGSSVTYCTCSCLCAHLYCGTVTNEEPIPSYLNIYVTYKDDYYYYWCINGISAQYRHIGPTLTEFQININSSYNSYFNIPGWFYYCKRYVCSPATGICVYCIDHYWCDKTYCSGCCSNWGNDNNNMATEKSAAILLYILYNAFAADPSICLCRNINNCIDPLTPLWVYYDQNCTLSYNYICYYQNCINHLTRNYTHVIYQEGASLVKDCQSYRASMCSKLPMYAKPFCCSYTIWNCCSGAITYRACKHVLIPGSCLRFVVTHTDYACYMC